MVTAVSSKCRVKTRVFFLGSENRRRHDSFFRERVSSWDFESGGLWPRACAAICVLVKGGSKFRGGGLNRDHNEIVCRGSYQYRSSLMFLLES